MSLEICNPKFDEFQGDPMVTWREKPNRDAMLMLNLYDLYGLWKSARTSSFSFGTSKYKLPDVFWQTRGHAICRALRFCGAKALVLDDCHSSKVRYQWFLKKPDITGSSAEYYYVLPVYAESAGLGSDTRVHVEFPHGETIHFDFISSQLQEWDRAKEPEDQQAPGA